MPERLLIVEDNEFLCNSLKKLFLKESYEVTAVSSSESALRALESQPYNLIITDIILPGIDGIELLTRVKEEYPEIIVIVMTSYATIESAIKAFRLGSYDYIIKPIINEEIKMLVKNALTQTSPIKNVIDTSQSLENKYDFSSIVGESPAIRSVIEEVKMVANSRSNVLILGETGTGKELIARAIHYNSKRTSEPFVAINCSAIPENLLESEFFGHSKGAFTGAVYSKRGLFEEADKGTVFLDEIGDLSHHLQVKLLRVLDDREIRPVGSLQSKKVDVRFIAATNMDLLNAVKQGRFREDLYYRLNVINLKLPPLRARGLDMQILAQYFLEKYSAEMGGKAKSIDEEAMTALNNYYWPGNIRELQNVVERAVILCDSAHIRLEHLPEELREAEPLHLDMSQGALSIEEFTKRAIIKYQSKFSEQELASMLGITRKALWEKRKRWGILKK
jgi:DNA-binding NtrC family response regulator